MVIWLVLAQNIGVTLLKKIWKLLKVESEYPNHFSCKAFFFIQNKLLYHYITNIYKLSLFRPWKQVIIDIEAVHLGAFTHYTHSNGDTAPAAGAPCAADSTEDCR